MITDFDIVCDNCKKTRHLGQSMGGACSFGFGSNDKEGSRDAAEWIMGHLNLGHTLRIEISDVAMERVSDPYKYVHDERFVEKTAPVDPKE